LANKLEKFLLSDVVVAIHILRCKNSLLTALPLAKLSTAGYLHCFESIYFYIEIMNTILEQNHFMKCILWLWKWIIKFHMY